MEFTTQELLPLAEQMAALCVNKVKQQEKAGHIMEIEDGLRHGLKQLGRMVLGSTLSQAEGKPVQQIACECGGELSYQRRRAAKIMSMFGWVTYERSYYANCQCGGGQAPLDKELGLAPGEVTAGLARLMALAGSALPFGESAQWVREFLLLEVSENSIRKETQTFGKHQEAVEGKRTAQSQDEVELQARLRTAVKRPKRLYGGLDGAHVRIEDPDEEEEWREMKVGCWFEVEAVPASQQTKRHRRKEAVGQQALRAKEQQYYCDILEVDQFADLFWAQACQANADLAEEVVFLGDGAQWIWRLVSTYFPQAVQIVDWHHAEEYLQKVAKDVFPAGEQRTAWLEENTSTLWEGNTAFVIRQCEHLASQSEEAAAALSYFRNNQDRMQYGRFRAQGYMIGSGTIESACKQIVSHRLRCSGAQWTVLGARHTAKARAAWLSHNQDWQNLGVLRAGLPLAA
jgi:hypothetical protein